MSPGIFGEGFADQVEEQNPDRRLKWHDDPAGFVRDCIKWDDGEGAAPYQEDVLTLVATEGRACVRSLHGVGKTSTAAFLVLWFACTRDAAGIDWKCITTAGAWRQLEFYLWPEIRLWARRLRWDVLREAGWKRKEFAEEKELQLLQLRLRHGLAMAAASSDPTLIEGAHAKEILYVFDEAKSIIPDIFDAAEGAFSTGTAYALCQSTPGTPSGRFYEIHQHRPGYEDWKTRHITLAEGIAAGRINETWAEQRAKQWGEKSALYQNRVLGNFASSEEDSVIPLAWIEEANERWNRINDEAQGSFGTMTDIGVDVARSGRDQTCFAPRYGDIFGQLRYYTIADTMETTGLLVAILRAHEEQPPRAVIDVIGIGAGVYDRTREQGYRRTVGFNASSGAGTKKDRSGQFGFINLRSYAWWNLREMLEPAFFPVLALPPDDVLIGDLTAPKWSVTSGGDIKVESKDDIRARLGRSTDAGDAVVQACLPRAINRRHARTTYAGVAH